MYANYGARGDDFVARVNDLANEEGEGGGMKNEK
jgi:hypothetical protein